MRGISPRGRPLARAGDMADDAAAQAGGADAPRDRAELYARALGRPALPPQQQQRAGDPVSVEFQAVRYLQIC